MSFPLFFTYPAGYFEYNGGQPRMNVRAHARTKHCRLFSFLQRMTPMWTKPAYTDLRIGFEVTMYFANR